MGTGVQAEGTAITPVSVAGGVLGDRAIVLAGIAVGLLLTSAAAPLWPEFVNGILLVLLVGIVLGNSSRWLPYFGQFSTASVRTVKR